MTLRAEQTRRPIPVDLQREIVTVTWRLSGPALKRARADLQLGDGDAMLHVQVRQGPTATAWIESAEGDCPIETVDDAGAWVTDGMLVHLELPRLIRATLDMREAPRLLYARTPLIEALGLAPGTYEPVGVRG